MRDEFTCGETCRNRAVNDHSDVCPKKKAGVSDLSDTVKEAVDVTKSYDLNPDELTATESDKANLPISLKPVAFGSYLRALRIINGERIYDQAIRLGVAPFKISEFGRGEESPDAERVSAKEVVARYELSRPQAAALLRCLNANELIRSNIKVEEG